MVSTVVGLPKSLALALPCTVLLIVEIKSVEAIAPVHKKQLLTHLRLADERLGLLINFNVALIKDGIVRIANGMQD
jgi:GxxExxY protein